MKREAILQTYALTGSYLETARIHDVAYQTVSKYVRSATEDDEPEVRKIRSKTLGRVAAKVAGKTEEVIDSITPEDLQSGRIPLYAKDGKTIVGYKSWGPSLSQKALAVGILADKSKILGEFTRSLDVDQASNQLPMPEDVDGLVRAIQGKVRSIKALQIDFGDVAPGLVKQTQDILEEVEVLKAHRDEVTVEDFDGNS